MARSSHRQRFRNPNRKSPSRHLRFKIRQCIHVTPTTHQRPLSPNRQLPMIPVRRTSRSRRVQIPHRSASDVP
jgi:hypothetical protein